MLQQDYVATFDLTRKCALYLTYFAYGDTRRRGMALVQFKQAYRAAGVEWDDDRRAARPPLRSPAVRGDRGRRRCVAAARRPPRRRGDAATRPDRLAQRRRHDRSPWAAALLALCDTLPALKGDEADAVRRLVEQGPRPRRSGCRATAPRSSRRPRSPWEHRDEHLPVGHRPLPLPGGLRRRARVALPLRQVRLDHPVLPALRGPAAAAGLPAVPLRHARRRRRPRHRAAGPAVVDGGGRRRRPPLPLRRGQRRPGRRGDGAGRHGAS